MHEQLETTLLAVTGLSPAVLTETLWELAHRTDPVIPNRIVILTTSTGAEAIRRQLLEPLPGASLSVWDELRDALLPDPKEDQRLAFGDNAHCLRVFSVFERGTWRDLSDIASPAENEAVADAIMRELWGLVSPPGTRLIVSIAGGLKTMSALMFSCMTLLGRRDDTITHVLVDAPYDSPQLTPRFYFPKQSVQDLFTPDSTAVTACNARIRLIEVPFVALRHVFQKELGNQPRSYSELMALCQQGVDRAVRQDVNLAIDPKQDTVAINGCETKLSPRQVAFLLYFSLARKEGRNHQDWNEAAERMSAVFSDEGQRAQTLGPWHRKVESWDFDARDLSRLASDLRGRLRQHPIASALVPFLPDADHVRLDIPIESIQLEGPNPGPR